MNRIPNILQEKPIFHKIPGAFLLGFFSYFIKKFLLFRPVMDGICSGAYKLHLCISIIEGIFKL